MAIDTPRRGRPRLHDVAELQRGAIEIVAREGYSEVTMGRVALELGVSIRTLHRHFPSKADLVWGALDLTFSRLCANLAATSSNLSVMGAISTAIVASIDDMMVEGSSGRERMRLIAVTPELQAAQSAAFREWKGVLVGFAAGRLDLPTDDVRPLAIGSAAQSATMTALAWWATQNDPGRPSRVVARALRALDVDAPTRDTRPG